MLKNMSFQWRLMSSFSFMGFLVLIVALTGWNGNSRLSNHINTLATNNLLSLDSLWKIKEGQTQIESAQRILFNSELTLKQRQDILALLTLRTTYSVQTRCLKRLYSPIPSLQFLLYE
ncbi:hypothetical protein F7734_09645 [Scytonema sp. UIC 10036]|uniref:hypothetical protein n=1 Tax=Scytonema sp. UIC 10036 TaxID=2304196 RepID=UPI0012DA39C4|nr:hypothetical protein [Scytonema sp. UIC 10036]MUG92701.1 hypothetical protein [Scytonema sp. UIC 10036]